MRTPFDLHSILSDAPAPMAPGPPDPMMGEAAAAMMGHAGILGGPPDGPLAREVRGAGRRVQAMGDAIMTDPMAAPAHLDTLGPRLGQRLRAVTDRFAQGASAAFDAPETTAKWATGTSTNDALASLARGLGRAGSAKDINAAYEELLPALAEHAAMPQMAADKARTAAMGLRSIDFGLADQIEAHASDRLSYLYETMPKPPGPQEQTDGWRPDPADLHTWARRVVAAERPEVMLDELRDGTLVPETVETVERLYPQHLAQVRDSLMQRAANGEQVPMQRRLAVSILLGGDDPEFRQPAIAAAQQRIKAVQQQAMEPNQAPGTPTAKSKTFTPSKMNPDAMEKPTSVQRAQER